MNKKIVLTKLLMFLVVSGFMQSAAAQTYFSGNIGAGLLRDSRLTDDVDAPGLELGVGFDTGYVFSAAVGRAFPGFRGELELSYQENDVGNFSLDGITVDAAAVGISGDTSVLTGMINGYYDLDMGTALTPYISAGVGYSDVDFTFTIDDPDVGTISEDDSDSAISFQIGVGAGYQISDNMVFDLRYRYFTADPKFGTTSSSFKNHIFTGGLRINF
jgi:outer membrane autotransporter protein